MNVFVDYVKKIQHLGFILMFIYLPIVPCMHEIHKNRFSLCYILNLELRLNNHLCSIMILI